MIEGFYGGKFLPMHIGHHYCIDTAARQCDHVVVIMFMNGDDEINVMAENNSPELKVSSRFKQVDKICKLYDNVDLHIIDCTELKNPDGSENWDAETPLVRKYVPKMDYVYSSEPGYEEYFARAYPEAKHILVDVKREKYPISSTMIRAMNSEEEKKKWMV